MKKDAEFEGADDQAEDVIGEINLIMNLGLMLFGSRLVER